MSTLHLSPPATETGPASPPPWWEDRRRRFAALGLGLWLLTGLYLVPADQQAVVTRFGAVVEPRVLPGLHVSLPWPIDRVEIHHDKANVASRRVPEKLGYDLYYVMNQSLAFDFRILLQTVEVVLFRIGSR